MYHIVTDSTNFSDRINGVLVSVIGSSVIYHGFQPRLGQTKDYKIGICYFAAKRTALRS